MYIYSSNNESSFIHVHNYIILRKHDFSKSDIRNNRQKNLFYLLIYLLIFI